jgi:hypothetical protein
MVAAKTVRYIKLGRGGCWEDVSLDRGELHFGHGKISHQLSLGDDSDAIKKFRIDGGRDPRAAAEDAREVLDFYRLGADCLWITFAREHLWWTFAEPKVTWLGSGKGHGERLRKSIGGWRRTDVDGKPLRMNGLSTRLTKVASYRRTLCSVEAEDYLLRRINGVEEPLVAKSALARDRLLATIAEAIASLHQADFETLIDVIFARSGWNRVSRLGGTQKLVDMVLEQPTLEERIAVQIKSSATQRELNQYVEDIDAAGTFERCFFVCHTPKGRLQPPTDRDDVYVWCSPEIAAAAVRLGLADWIIEKIST